MNVDEISAPSNATLMARIVCKLAEGMTMHDAVDSVLGAGAYDRMVGESEPPKVTVH